MSLTLTYPALRLILDGMLLMMVLYSLASFAQQRKPIYWQYALYILCMIFTFYFDDKDYKKANYAPGANYWVVLLESVAFMLYIQFSISLIEIPKYDPKSHNILKIILKLLIFETILDTVLFRYNLVSSETRSTIYIIFRFLVAVGALVVVPRIYRLKQAVVAYFISGSFFFVMGCLVALVTNFVPQILVFDPTNPLTFPVTYIEIGVVLEVLCYTLGISLKNRENEIEKIKAQGQLIEQLKENEKKQQALQRIRDEIARDLHDELGADLGSISMLSHVAGVQVKSRPKEAKETLEIIGKTARNVASTMRQIVWSLHSRHDSVDNFEFRLKETAYILFEHLPIDLKLELTDIETDLKIPIESRRDLFLMYKEILNNIVRHAQAKNVSIKTAIIDQNIQIQVEDDGIGFDTQNKRLNGNGLANLKQRAEAFGGRLTIESQPANGTQVIVLCPLAYQNGRE